jgi:hypothetical protein
MLNKEEKQLLYSIETKLTTLMIGSIARFENSFGYLWNNGDDPMNDTQEMFRQKWEDLRIDLLNHGNYQIRLANNQIVDFFEKPNKYKYKYTFINPEKKRDNK